jgi:hypothetical protein
VCVVEPGIYAEYESGPNETARVWTVQLVSATEPPPSWLPLPPPEVPDDAMAGGELELEQASTEMPIAVPQAKNAILPKASA